MPRRGDNIHKRKDGRWEGRYKNGFTQDGTVKYSSVYAPTYTECKIKLEKAKQNNQYVNRKQSKFRFADILYQWFESNQIRLKGATEAKYLNIIETHIIPELGEIKISKINSMIVNSFLEKKLQCGGIKDKSILSPSYVKTMAIIIEAAIKYAVSEGLCPPLKTPIHKPTIPKKELTVLSESAESDLTQFLLCEESHVALGSLLALQVGLRIGEVCALRWCDIDFKNDIIHVRHTVSRVSAHSENQKTMLILDTPKTESSLRDLPIPSTLKDILWKAYLRRKSEFIVSDDLNFVGTRTFDYQYRRMLETNGIQIINFHTLRHTFATRCAESGMDAKTLSLLLGHSTASTTLNIYVHPSMEIMKQQIERVHRLA